MKKITSRHDLKGYTGFVLFSATWCQPCKNYKPVLQDYCEKLGYRYAEVDADESRDLMGMYGVRSVPTTFFFVNGSPQVQRSGAMTVAALNQLVPR